MRKLVEIGLVQQSEVIRRILMGLYETQFRKVGNNVVFSPFVCFPVHYSAGLSHAEKAIQ